MSLSIANVIRVTLLSPARGLADVNTSALAIMTDEAPINPFPLGYATYLDAISVANDFGSNSDTFKLATIIFSQKKNILTGGGFLVVIPRLQGTSATPAKIQGSGFVDFTSLPAGTFYINANVNGGGAADIEIGEIDPTDISTILDSLNSANVTSAGLEFVVDGIPTSARVTLQTIATGSTKSVVIGTTSTDIDIAPLLKLSGSATGSDAGVESVKDCIIRTQGSIPYFGIVLNEKMTDVKLLEVASIIQGLDKFIFVGSSLTGDIDGVFKDVLDSGFTHTRCLFYSTSEFDALLFAAGYGSLGLSTNYDNANTVSTMHLKEITGLVADAGLSQTLLDLCMNNGVDSYADFGIPALFTSGLNEFFDFIYGKVALKLRLTIAGFNYLKRTQTRIPQTEDGMNGLKGAYEEVMKLFVTNGFLAPGQWKDSTTFGNPEDHIRNIADFGYFIYSLPIAQQSQNNRLLRKAPGISIAGKSAGAIHSSDVVIFVEA